MNHLLSFYAVRNRDGLWFRRKGYGGYGESWVKDLKLARFYGKPGSARGQITFWSKNYPQFGVPELVELKVTDMVVVDESSKVLKRIEAHKVKEAKRQLRQLELDKENAKRRFQDAKKEIERLGIAPS